MAASVPVTFARVLVESGLSHIELAALYGVSRQSVYNWAEGRTPRGVVARVETSISAKLCEAIDAKRLPLRVQDPVQRRRIVQALATSLRKLPLE